MVTAMLALSPLDETLERTSILCALNYNPSVESYVFENLDNEVEEFFLVEHSFWEQWCQSVSFGKAQQFELKVEHKTEIENASKLLEPLHKHRFKANLTYGTDYVVLPKFVFFPLS